MIKIAVDTNILIYSINTSDGLKQNIAIELLRRNPVISSQNISEFANVCRNRLKFDKKDSIELVLNVLNFCQYQPTSTHTYKSARLLIEKYDFQIFDAIIVAAALENNCAILYTEDLHHGQVIENTLRIENPFL